MGFGMDRQVWCVTHSDLDGYTSAAVVKREYPNTITLITNYGKPRPLWKIKGGDLCFVTDFTLDVHEFKELASRGVEIVWIDHHKHNIDTAHNQGWTCKGIQRDDYCGAALTWMYLHPNAPIESMPQVVKFANDYDLWKFEDPRTKAYNYGTGLWDIRPGVRSGDYFWSQVFDTNSPLLELVIRYGTQIQKYVEPFQDTLCADMAYRTTLQVNGESKTVLALPARTGNSSVFDRQDRTGADAVFTSQFVSNIGRYRCSMYSPDNVKEILPIVVAMGGGGHPKAAGWQCDLYPLALPKAVDDPGSVVESISGYKKLNEIRDRSSILKQYVDKGSNASAKSQCFYSSFGKYEAVAANHHFLPDLLRVITLAFSSINPETSLMTQMYIGWSINKNGWYRCCAYPADSTISLDNIVTEINEVSGNDAVGVTKDYGGVWWWQKKIPVKTPAPVNPQSLLGNN